MRPVLLAAACAALPHMTLAQTVEVDTAIGPVQAPARPGTVAVFDLAAIDALDALGIAIHGVPDVAAPAYLQDAMAPAETVGTLFEPDFEALAAMAPDLIVAGGRSQAQVDPLGRIAPTLDMTITGDDLVGQARARIVAYGAIFGREDEADDIVAAFDATISSARAAVADKGDVLILLTNGGKLSAYGDDSRFGWIHTELGLAEAYPDLTADSHGEAVSFEFVASVDPDWILVIDRGAAIGQEGEAAQATLDTPLIAGTTAGETGQIVYLDSGPLYLAGGGIQSMTGTIGEIVAAMGDTGS